jgi:lon-related putative ATP-dependent protease
MLDYRELSNTSVTDNIDKLSPKGPLSDHMVGQERAINALKIGLGMRAEGFNIYVSGLSGSGRLSLVKKFIEEKAKSEPLPPDWCYVNNFKDSYSPRKLSLPAGMATAFKKEMRSLIDQIYQSLVKAFESEEYNDRKVAIVNILDEKQNTILGKIAAKADAESFAVRQTSVGIVTIPLKNKKPVTEEQLKNMSEAELDALSKRQDKLKDEINTDLREIRKYQKETETALDKLAVEVAEYAAGNLIGDFKEKYERLPGVCDFLDAVKADILDNLPEFMQSSKSSPTSDPQNPDKAFLKRYEVTVLVDNSAQQGAPLIIERNPTYNNLLGRVEKESYMGTLVTDFTMIRKGSLHSANHGYLVLRAEELLSNYFSWTCLKRALKNREIVIEEATDQLGYLTTKTLKPESIPLDVKVVLIGDPYLYQLLYQYDGDFRELFKVKADIDSTMAITDKNLEDYLGLVASLTNEEQLLQLDSPAKARVVEYASRLADDQQKLSTQFGKISDILRESDYYAKHERASYIGATHVLKAIEQKTYRSNLIQDKINEMMTSGQIFIDISGQKAGQINGLSVLSMGDISFGIPSRITCSISLGKGGIIGIEREAELSGPIHTKGVMILTGYLSHKFMQDKPVSLTARLVFEQSYSMVEGDSASSTELYAIISALSNIPIKQGIAVTGSVNQKGEIQPIGGVNEKIEGYYEVCKRLGFNGEQGVIIPAANIRNLVLKEEVRDAVRDGLFSIWVVDTIEDGIELLTGVKAGSIWEEGTVFWNVNNTLLGYTERLRNSMTEEEDLLEV